MHHTLHNRETIVDNILTFKYRDISRFPVIIPKELNSSYTSQQILQLRDIALNGSGVR